MAILGFILLAGVALLAITWLILLVTGIVLWRRGNRRVGKPLTIAGGVLAVPGLGVIGLVAFAMFQFSGSDYPTFETFDPESYTGPVATLSAPSNLTVTLTLLARGNGDDEKLGWRLQSEDGMLAAPAGTFTVYQVTCATTDTNGAWWHASCYLGSANDGDLNLPAGTTSDLPYGPPFSVMVAVDPDGAGMLALDLVFRDRSEHTFNYRRQGAGADPETRFRICDANGEVIDSGAFEYG